MDRRDAGALMMKERGALGCGKAEAEILSLVDILADSDASVLARQANFHLIKGYTRKAIEFSEAAINKLAPDDPGAPDVHACKESCLIRMGRVEEGLAYAEKHGCLGHTLSAVWEFDAMLRLGRFDDALKQPFWQGFMLLEGKPMEELTTTDAVWAPVLASVLNLTGGFDTLCQQQGLSLDRIGVIIDKCKAFLDVEVVKVEKAFPTRNFDPLSKEFNEPLYLHIIGGGWCHNAKALIAIQQGLWAAAKEHAATAIETAGTVGDQCMLSWSSLTAGERSIREALSKLPDLDPGEGAVVGAAASAAAGAAADNEAIRALLDTGLQQLTVATEHFEVMPELYGVAFSQLMIGVAHHILGDAAAAAAAFAKNLHGFTAVHLAGVSGARLFLDCAMTAGGDLAASDHQGYNVLDYATLANRHDVRRLLLDLPAGKEMMRDSDTKVCTRDAILILHAARKAAEGAESSDVSWQLRTAFKEKILAAFPNTFAPMVVVSLEKFTAFGAMPRSSDGLGVDATELPASAFIVFVSHRWLRGAATPPHPDDEHETKFKQICGLVTAVTRAGHDPKNVYLWVDFASIEQDDGARLARGVNALPLYVQCANLVISMSNQPEYYERAWCRLEVCFAKAAFTTQGFPEMREPKVGVRGAGEGAGEGAGQEVELGPHRAIHDPAFAEMVRPENVRTAKLTCEADRHVVRFLSTQSSLL